MPRKRQVCRFDQQFQRVTEKHVGGRSLVASRAAVFGALAPAPKDAAEREKLKKEVIDLCRWKVSDRTVAAARQRIRDTHGGQAPKVLDMFAGGGAIPLEALRLGCEAYALDLNLVAHLIDKYKYCVSRTSRI